MRSFAVEHAPFHTHVGSCKQSVSVHNRLQTVGDRCMQYTEARHNSLQRRTKARKVHSTQKVAIARHWHTFRNSKAKANGPLASPNYESKTNDFSSVTSYIEKPNTFRSSSIAHVFRYISHRKQRRKHEQSYKLEQKDKMDRLQKLRVRNPQT